MSHIPTDHIGARVMTLHEEPMQWQCEPYAVRQARMEAQIGIGMDRIKYAMEAAGLDYAQRIDALKRALAAEIGSRDLGEVLDRLVDIVRADAEVHWDAARELRNAAIGVCEDWGIE